MLWGTFYPLATDGVAFVVCVGKKMGKNGSPVIEGAFGKLFGSAMGRVLDVLILHRGHDLSQKELAEYAGVSTKSLSKIMPRLVASHVAKETRKVGNARMVTLDLANNPLADHLVAIEFELSMEAADN